MTKKNNQLLYLVLMLFISLPSFATHYFNPKTNDVPNFKYIDFPKGKFDLKIDTVKMQSYRIEIIQVSLKENIGKGIVEKIWIRLYKSNIFFKQFYFDDFSSSQHEKLTGIFFSDKQLRRDCFIATIYGLKEPKIIILNKKGDATLLDGEKYFISNDKQFLFAHHNLSHGLTVYNLNTDKILYSGKLDFAIDKWYFHNDHYYANIQNDPRSNNKINILYFDFKNNSPILRNEMNGFIRYDKALAEYNPIDGLKSAFEIPAENSSSIAF